MENSLKIARRLMEENTFIGCIGYDALTEIAERMLGKSPYGNGKGWLSAFKRMSRELYARDSISVGFDVRTTESEYVIFDERKEKGKKQIRGISLRKSSPIDLDTLLGKDDE